MQPCRNLHGDIGEQWGRAQPFSPEIFSNPVFPNPKTELAADTRGPLETPNKTNQTPNEEWNAMTDRTNNRTSRMKRSKSDFGVNCRIGIWKAAGSGASI